MEDSKQFLEDANSDNPNANFPDLIPDGFVHEPSPLTLGTNTIIDRYGEPTGSFLAPQGTPKWARSLKFNAELKRYRVVKPLDVSAGRTAPWFGKPGGGIQYKLLNDKTVQELIPEYLEEL